MKYIAEAIAALKPGAEWSLNGDNYSGLTWLDTKQTQPTEEEINVKVAELQYQEEVNVYQEKRKSEYPDWGDQLDKIYHSGIDAWKADIKKIKDKYPKQTMDATELQKRKDAAIFNLQKRDYEKAVTRLARYELSAGVKEESIPWNGRYIVEPLPIEVDGERNPKIVQDEQERIAAQIVISKTPQAVIDSVSS